MTIRGEFELIARHFAPLATHPGAFTLKDDAAVLAPHAGFLSGYTVDALVAGVHFLPDDPPGLIAKKALRVNLSDLAAMAAHPVGYLLALALPAGIDETWIAAFARALGEDQREFGLSLLGGDTVSTSGPVTISVTAIGEVESDDIGPLRRDGAQAGDDIYVSGSIGDAALGLDALRGQLGAIDKASEDYLIDRYRLPRPRIELARAVRRHAHAAMDISDGLVQDLGHIARASNAGADIELDSIPLSPAARAAAADRVACITAGDDYELMFMAAPSQTEAIAEAASRVGVAVTRVGRVARSNGVRVRGGNGGVVPIERAGFTHF